MQACPWGRPMETRTETAADQETRQQAIEEFQIAKELLGRLYVLIRTARSYDRANAAMLESAQALHASLGQLIDQHDSVRFDVVNDCVFFNRVRMRSKVAGFHTLKFFVNEAKRRGIRSIIFDEMAEIDDLLSFAIVFAHIDPTLADPFAELQRQIELEGIAGIDIKPVKKSIEDALHEVRPVSTKEEAKRSFFSALHMVKEAVKESASKGKVNPRKVKRVVESVVDSILSDEESMMALTAIKDYDEYTYHHSFNVCIYSIALGNRLGLPRQALCEVGIAALFHDVGKTDVPRNVLNKVEDLTEADWQTIQEHTLSGVKVLTYLKKMDRVILRSMVVAFCHHMNMDRSGYPKTKAVIKPDAFSRIVRIADVYDALTSARSYRMKPFKRAEALAIITGKAGKELDPTLCAIFAEAVGGLPDEADASQIAALKHPQTTDDEADDSSAVSAVASPDSRWDFPTEDPVPPDDGDDAVDAETCLSDADDSEEDPPADDRLPDPEEDDTHIGAARNRTTSPLDDAL
jgi:HD-GYP domain-containing protein (c-di-GMP phosphodiesterase class II)